MRPAFVLLSVVAALAVGAAAGVAANPRDEKVRLNPADTALAQRAVLRRGDLAAGWSAAAPTAVREEPIRCARYDPDLSRFTITGRARSAFLSRGTGSSVASSVQVFPTAAQASADFELATRPALMTCVSARLLRDVRSAGADGARLASRQMSTTPRIGAESATYTFVLELTGGQVRLRYRVALVTFRTGRAIGVMSFGAVGDSSLDELALARRVAGRL